MHNDFSEVWVNLLNEAEVPIPPLSDPVDPVPVPVVDVVPVPCCSAQGPAPSAKSAEIMGLNHLPCIVQAVIDLHKAGIWLKEQRKQAKFDQRQQVLNQCTSLTNVTPPVSPSILTLPTDAIPDDALPPLPILDADTDFVAFCKAYAAELASPLINPCNPDNPTFHEAMPSPNADKWTQGAQES